MKKITFKDNLMILKDKLRKGEMIYKINLKNYMKIPKMMMIMLVTAAKYKLMMKLYEYLKGVKLVFITV